VSVEFVDELVDGDDDDEEFGRGGEDLLAGVCSSACFDEPASGRNSIGAVDREVEAVSLSKG
jgi:hypothetical protein